MSTKQIGAQTSIIGTRQVDGDKGVKKGVIANATSTTGSNPFAGKGNAAFGLSLISSPIDGRTQAWDQLVTEAKDIGIDLPDGIDDLSAMMDKLNISPNDVARGILNRANLSRDPQRSLAVALKNIAMTLNALNAEGAFNNFQAVGQAKSVQETLKLRGELKSENTQLVLDCLDEVDIDQTRVIISAYNRLNLNKKPTPENPESCGQMIVQGGDSRVKALKFLGLKQ